MGVSKNWGTPKWMVKIMENPIKMDDLGGKPTIFGNPHISRLMYQQPHLVPTSLGLYRVQQALMMSVVFKALSARPGEWSKYMPHAKLKNVH